MKTLAHILVALGILVTFVGISSKLAFRPLPMVKGGLTAQALFISANTCFLLAIIFILLEMLKNRKQ